MSEEHPLTIEEMEVIAQEFRDALEDCGPNSDDHVRATFLEGRGLTQDERRTIWDLAMKPRG
jgi:hypothetical protein